MANTKIQIKRSTDSAYADSIENGSGNNTINVKAISEHTGREAKDVATLKVKSPYKPELNKDVIVRQSAHGLFMSASKDVHDTDTKDITIANDKISFTIEGYSNCPDIKAVFVNHTNVYNSLGAKISGGSAVWREDKDTPNKAYNFYEGGQYERGTISDTLVITNTEEGTETLTGFAGLKKSTEKGKKAQYKYSFALTVAALKDDEPVYRRIKVSNEDGTYSVVYTLKQTGKTITLEVLTDKVDSTTFKPVVELAAAVNSISTLTVNSTANWVIEVVE